MSGPGAVLVRASVENVLGEYNHEIRFESDDEYKIIFGPNGVGKTKFLEVINAVSRLNTEQLRRLPFTTAELSYSDGITIRATSSYPEPSEFINYAVIPGRTSPDSVLYWTDHGTDNFKTWLETDTSWFQLGNGNLWQDSDDGETVHFEELKMRYGAPVQKQNRDAIDGDGDEIRELMSQRNSWLIETQRLRNHIRSPARRRGPFSNKTAGDAKISEQANELTRRVSVAQEKHSLITQKLDRTFPTRFLANKGAIPRPIDEIQSDFADQNNFRSRVARVASIDLETVPSLPDQLDTWEQRLIDQYLKDTAQKLEPFRDLMEKIDLLESIVNSRFLNKKIEATSKAGLKVTRTDNGNDIPLESLSSGEQHEIILLFDLLFNVEPGALVMIDEPEISLHVAWQLQFIPDVTRIAKLVGFRFIVATHSPQIMNGRRSAAVRLGPTEARFE